jgi:glutamate/tyrosine decarboxylase-like PLP-dependent enzyme
MVTNIEKSISKWTKHVRSPASAQVSTSTDVAKVERVIPNFASKFANEFLTPQESNIGTLVSKIELLAASLSDVKHKRQGRRAIDSHFDYKNETKDSEIPLQGLDYNQATARSLEAFEGTIRWHNPNALFNLVPSPLLDTVALSTLTTLYNPNAFYDFTAGKFNLIEKRVVKALAKLAGWDWEKAGGFYTTGGKSTLLYAIKTGINKSDRQVINEGLTNNHVVITSAACHFSIESVCNYLGIGQNNCIRIPTGANGTIDLVKLKTQIEDALSQGKQIACVIASGGGTLNLAIDPVYEIRKILDQAADDFNLSYKPHLHFDTVISWAWLFFNADPSYYRTQVTNANVLAKIESAAKAIRQIEAADSFGIDFHKTGLCPAVSSFFVAKSFEDPTRTNIGRLNSLAEHDSFGDARYCDITIENSRACLGIISAYHVLQRFGIHGFQDYLSYLLHIREKFRQSVSEKFSQVFEIVNPHTQGFELVLKINFFGDTLSYQQICQLSEARKEQYREICEEFRQFITYGKHCNDTNVPFIGYVRKYSFGTEPGDLPAFLLYPTSVYTTDETVEQILGSLQEAVQTFKQAKATGEPVLTKRKDLQKDPPK